MIFPFPPSRCIIVELTDVIYVPWGSVSLISQYYLQMILGFELQSKSDEVRVFNKGKLIALIKAFNKLRTSILKGVIRLLLMLQNK